MYEIKEIVWYDATSDDGHMLAERVNSLTPAIRRNTGYVLKDDGDFITITFGVLDMDPPQFDHPLAIPKSMIKKITPLGSTVNLPDNSDYKVDWE